MKTIVVNYPAMNVPASIFLVTVIKGLNSLPSFVPEPSLYHVIVKTKASELWSYKLPTLVDLDGENVSVSIQAPANALFVTFEAHHRTIKIEDLADEAVKVGTYTIKVELDDSHDTVTY